MLIKYNGPKPVKTVYYPHKDWGVLQYVFNPICKVTDSDCAKFLLHPDRKGLFSIVDDKEAPKDVPEGKKPEPGYVAPPSLDRQAISRKRGRPRKAEEPK